MREPAAESRLDDFASEDALRAKSPPVRKLVRVALRLIVVVQLAWVAVVGAACRAAFDPATVPALAYLFPVVMPILLMLFCVLFGSAQLDRRSSNAAVFLEVLICLTYFLAALPAVQ